MKWWRDGLAASIIAILAALLTTAPPVDRLRGASLDLIFLLRDLAGIQTEPASPAPVAIIAIDEETYRSPPFQDTPRVLWTRDIAHILTALVAADVKVVGFDVVYPTSVDRFIPRFDRTFLISLRRAAQKGKVVLGKVQHQIQPITPFSGQRLAVMGEQNIRSLNLLTDDDGIIRRVPLLLNTLDGKLEPALALTLAERSLGQSAERTNAGVRLGDWTIPGSENNSVILKFEPRIPIPSYSLHDLAACLKFDNAADFFHAQFAGKTVLLGTVLDVEDRKVTAMRWITRPETPATGPRCASEPRYDLFDATHVRDSVPGVFIHATAVRNLLERQVLTATPPWADHAFDLLFAACAALLGLLFKPIRAGMTLLGVFIVWAAMAGVTLDQGFVLPLIVPMIASAAAFGAMLGWRFAVTDRESRFLHDSFSLYLAPDLVDGLVNDNNPPALGGEEREVTLYFSDLAGFSTMSEGLAPMETVRIMNAYLGAMTEEIERHGGVVDKYIGDAIVAIFGAPLPTPDHAERAAQAALDCGARLVQLNRELTGLKAPLGHRIGLNSGRALIGNIGSDRRFNYTAMGDTVNLAARLEGANKVFGTEILVSETTAKGAPDIPWRELDSIRVVGRSTPVAVLTPLLPGEEALAEAYGAALAAFRQRDFSRTLECLAAVTQPDKASALLRQRAQSYQNTPPPADWQPINDLVEK